MYVLFIDNFVSDTFEAKVLIYLLHWWDFQTRIDIDQFTEEDNDDGYGLNAVEHDFQREAFMLIYYKNDKIS